ncbi:MAG TPA: hypothetical protein VM327_04120 [Candidatus Thermoplasmatota archaeon]|nr:hypothetical protein [Candidatus Thermoplasmatota archaeon]
MMGHGRPSHSRRYRAADGESAVTPVIGAILILAITILGIGGVLFWGAPVIERIQAQNAQTAVVGEFEELRDSSRDLSVPDHSRFPTIVVPRGDLSLQQGSRFLVTADRDAGFKPCDLHVINWADTTAKTAVTISQTGCRSGSTVQIYSVSGGTLVAQTVAVSGTTYTVAGADFSAGDWLFRLFNAAAPVAECPANICAEAWLHSTDQISWTMASSSGKRTVSFDNGAIFSDSGGALFLEEEAAIGDSIFGSQYYGLWMRSLVASGYSGVSGAGSHQVYLSLLGNYDRADTAGVYRLRFDSTGTLAQGWCNAFLLRNAALPDGSDADTLPDSSYRSDTGTGSAACGTTAGDSAGARSVCYALLPSASNSCTTTPTTAFTFRFLHARIYTSLAA